MLGQIQMRCDAPPYGVVCACKRCGISSPLDVRWCRMSHFVNGNGQRTGNIFARLWQRFFGRGNSNAKTCTCGQPLPNLKRYAFSVLSITVGDYMLGQCSRCRTVFWDTTLLLPAWMEENEIELTDSVEI